ncbi:MAG: penicillin-binding transpeptidase domain-containing protein [Polyangiales bacterium]
MKIRAGVVAALGLAGAAAPLFMRGRADAQRSPSPSPVRVAVAPIVDAGPERAPEPVAITGLVPGFAPQRARHDRSGRYVVAMPEGRRATLTLEPAWQRDVQALLARHALPYAAVVVVDSADGRVRVWAGRGGADPAREAVAPAASVFKIVTTSALYAAGVSERETTCYSGGFHALTARDLVADPRRDRDCATLPEAFAHSTNTVFARRALEHLRPDVELAAARAWGFGEPVPFDAAVSSSAANIPEDTLGFARTCAGFWNSTLSPLHGAMLAQGVAARGQMARPWIVERVDDARGRPVMLGGARPWRRAVSPEVAAMLSRAMARTVAEGTATSAFRDRAGRRFLEGVTVGGKTGTLTAARPYRAWTWFVGNAEDATRRLSFAVLVGNDPVWRVRAPVVARQVLQIAFQGRVTD